MRKLLFTFCLTGFALFAADDLPSVATATVRTATVPVVTVPLAEVVVPGVALTRVEVPAAVLADCGIATPKSDLSDRSDQSDKGRTASVPLATVPDLSGNLAAAKASRKRLSIFRDQRSVLADPAAVPGSPVYQAWAQIYADHRAYTPAYVPLPTGLRMIAEVRLPVTREVLRDNLAFYAKRGYTAVLLTFDGSENPGELSALARECRAAGLAPWFAFGGREDLKLGVLIAPGTLSRLIEELAPLCDGMLLGWRRTSLHLFLPDRAFTDYLIRSARAKNPHLRIVGESYLGHTAEAQERFAVTTSVPDNASGCLLVNVGYSMVSPKVMETVFGAVKAPKVVLVLGSWPYYQTVKPNGLSFEANLKIKETIETRFRAAGATGTVTLHGDGSDGIYNRNYTDNLAQTGRN